MDPFSWHHSEPLLQRKEDSILDSLAERRKQKSRGCPTHLSLAGGLKNSFWNRFRHQFTEEKSPCQNLEKSFLTDILKCFRHFASEASNILHGFTCVFFFEFSYKIRTHFLAMYLKITKNIHFEFSRQKCTQLVVIFGAKIETFAKIAKQTNAILNVKILF